MNVSRLLIATACSVAVIGAATAVVAQTTTPTQTPPATTAPADVNSTTQRPSDSTTPYNDSRSSTDRTTMDEERAARIDRN